MRSLFRDLRNGKDPQMCMFGLSGCRVKPRRLLGPVGVPPFGALFFLRNFGPSTLRPPPFGAPKFFVGASKILALPRLPSAGPLPRLHLLRRTPPPPDRPPPDRPKFRFFFFPLSRHCCCFAPDSAACCCFSCCLCSCCLHLSLLLGRRPSTPLSSHLCSV